MHPNPIFRREPAEAALARACARGFGVLAVNAARGDEGPLCAHVPFVVVDGVVGMHLAVANPILGVLAAGPVPAVLIVSGPDAYISPDWYGPDLPDQVPTWNYLATHLRGELRLLDDAALPSHLAALSAEFESRLLPKAPWTMDKMSAAGLARMQRQIRPVALFLERVESTVKLSQNKATAIRQGIVAGLAGQTDAGSAAIAALLRADLGE